MKTVMIVDDSRIMRNIVKKTFKKLQIPANYLEAPDGEKALEILKNNRVDLVLLDWNIPYLTGIDFLIQVRAMEKYSSIPIVMITSEASKFNIVEAVKAGVTGYIVKPFSEEDFINKISRISF